MLPAFIGIIVRARGSPKGRGLEVPSSRSLLTALAALANMIAAIAAIDIQY